MSRRLAEDEAVGDECSVAVITDDGDVLARGRRGTERTNDRAVFQINRLHVAVTPPNRYTVGMELQYATEHDMVTVEHPMVPAGLPSIILLSHSRGSTDDNA